MIEGKIIKDDEATVAELLMNAKFDELKELGFDDDDIFELYEKCLGIKLGDKKDYSLLSSSVWHSMSVYGI